MKKIVYIFCLFFFCAFSTRAQLNISHNSIRIGDEIIKQQVEYKDPGQVGQNQVWDFSKLKMINDAYSLKYSSPSLQGDSLYIMGDYKFEKKKVLPDELIVGIEHNTMYNYRLKNDTLILLGHENPMVRLTYTNPIVLMSFPLNYGQQGIIKYEAEGLYSGTVSLHNNGMVRVEADAFGKMILPTGDTLNPVLRVKTTKFILDKGNKLADKTILNEGKEGKQMETCQWYTKGYRYPVFETIRTINLKDSTEIFSTAFFFPPQDHYYLDTDPENLALLDSLWDVEENILKSIDRNQITVNDNNRYRIYPNPVQSTLYVDYTLEVDSPVSIQLLTLSGVLVKAIDHKSQAKGYYTDKINCASLPTGVYILKLKNNKETINQKVIKK